MAEVWKAMGCYQNRGRALGDILLEVGPLANITSKLDACKNTAAQQGVSVLGLDDMKCWTGKNAASTYHMYGTAHLCKTNNMGNIYTGMGSFASESIFVYIKDNNGN